jgi:hypothetical protein
MANQVEKWNFFEVSQAGQPLANPFDVDFGAEFHHSSRSVKVAGFYDGDGLFKVRFMPDIEGEWKYVTYSSLGSIHGQSGSFECVPPSPNNHGLVRVADQFHFIYADGTPYIPVGTTCYVWNLQGNELEEQTLKTLDQAPFNKMRMCVFPKRYSFNVNEPPNYPFPGEVTQVWDFAQMLSFRSSEPPKYWDFSRFNPEYFRRLERRILDLQQRGIEADLIIFHPYDFGAWGFDRMPAEVNDRYLKYLVARLAAFRNLWWSFANEYDLFVGRTMENWDHYMQLVQQIDPYDHLRSIHNCFSFYDHTKPWVTHCSIQNHLLSKVPTWRKKYGKPIVIDECGYEGDIHMMWGDLSAEEMVLRFWFGFVLGGYVGHGETYVNPEEVLWWSKGGDLHGESAPRIAFLREIFEGAPGLTPIEKLDNESIQLSENVIAELFSGPKDEASRIIAEGGWNVEAAGYSGRDYFLFYYGMHQPGSRNFNLPEGSFRIDVLDTWNMTISTAAESATGSVKVDLPGKKYIAIRIQRNP